MNLPPRCPPLPAHCPPPYPRPPRREGVRAVVMHMVLCRLTVLYTVSRYTGPSLGVCKTCIHLVACGLCKCLCACACALFVCSFLFCVHLAFDVSCVASCDRWERAPCAAAGRRQGAEAGDEMGLGGVGALESFSTLREALLESDSDFSSSSTSCNTALACCTTGGI